MTGVTPKQALDLLAFRTRRTEEGREAAELVGDYIADLERRVGTGGPPLRESWGAAVPDDRDAKIKKLEDYIEAAKFAARSNAQVMGEQAHHIAILEYQLRAANAVINGGGPVR